LGVVHPDWIWVPAHYIWTPRGYIHVGGYWDYPVIHRGVLFAPVFFTPRVHFGITYLFSPGFVINLNVFDDALFLRPQYSHYYYGNYYAPRYYRQGIYPWFSLHARRVVYDPIFAHQRWHHRKDHDWENHLHKRFREHRKQKGLRPPKTYNHRTQPNRAGKWSGSARVGSVIPLDRSGKATAGVYRFKPLSEKERKAFSQREKAVRTYQKERQHRETPQQNRMDSYVSKKPVPNKVKFSRSPIMDRSGGKSGRKKAPPAQYKAPKPNPDVEPLQRKHDLSGSWNRSLKSENKGRKPEIRERRLMDNPRQSGDKDRPSQNRLQKSNDRQQRGNGGWQRSIEQ